MKRWCLAAAITALVLLAVVVGAFAFVVSGGISARNEPSRTEARLARALRGWGIPSSARETPNPVPPSPRVLAGGRAHFADHCAICHANDGSGDTDLGRNLHPRAPDMRRRETQALTDGELFYIIENGVRLTGMPAWGGAGSHDGSWELVHFIRHLPKLTEQEKAEMEALNPKSPDEWRAIQGGDARAEDAAPEPAPHGPHSH
jgi:mono/diheme cytochrome c family protein